MALAADANLRTLCIVSNYCNLKGLIQSGWLLYFPCRSYFHVWLLRLTKIQIDSLYIRQKFNNYRYYKDHYRRLNGSCGNASDFYLGGPEFESRLSHRQPEQSLCGCSHFLQANNCVMNSVTSNHFVLFFPVYSLLTLTRLVAAIQIKLQAILFKKTNKNK